MPPAHADCRRTDISCADFGDGHVPSCELAPVEPSAANPLNGEFAKLAEDSASFHAERSQNDRGFL